MGQIIKNALIAHPDTQISNMLLGSKMKIVGSDVLKVEYVLIGAIDTILFPREEIPDWQNELWRHTCFEAFLTFDGGYAEFNFSPSRRYAIYRFEGYRDGMRPALDLPGPSIYLERNEERYALTAWIDLRRLMPAGIGQVGLSAVIEAKNGTKSYWALAHAPGPPDFHNPDCFIATLPAPDAP